MSKMPNAFKLIWRFLLVLIIFLLVVWLLLGTGLFQKFSPKGGLRPEDIGGHFDPSETAAVYNNKPISPSTYLASAQPSQAVLGDSTADKQIVVDLTEQRLYAYEDGREIYNFAISSGKWGRTPKGKFKIWIKLRYTKMEGGSRALRTYYHLPNVPYVMYFYNDEIPMSRGYGIHGTYWHDNFGQPMSHGCINMRTEEVELLYHWAKPDLRERNSVAATPDNPGTEIIIRGEAAWE